MKWQDSSSQLQLYTDSDWGNYRVTRKSHSGGALCLGQHLLAHWCRIQPSIALSSGEAEIYSSCRGLSNSLGIWNTLHELSGPEWGRLSLHVDASVCKSVVLRRGAGSIKHLETKDLWIQEAIRIKSIDVIKVPREVNVADCQAIYSNAENLQKHASMMGLRRVL